MTPTADQWKRLQDAADQLLRNLFDAGEHKHCETGETLEDVKELEEALNETLAMESP